MIYCAPYVLPVNTEPLLDGAVLVEQDKIAAVGPEKLIRASYPSHEAVELQHLLMPGFVNCHTHLELSVFADKIHPGPSFTDWLRRIIELRTLWVDIAGADWQSQMEDSIRLGIEQLLAGGTTCVADVSASGISKKLLENAGLRGIVFLEAIGFQSGQAQDISEKIKNKLQQLGSGDGHMRTGLSPHAPYSVSPALFQRIKQLAAGSGDNCKLSVHLAESREEEMFLERGDGNIQKLLAWRGSWDEKWRPPGCSAVQYLNKLQMLSSDFLAVHLNYLQPRDYSILARQKVHAVTCPASNAWLGHENLHLRALRRHGVNIALGSDSLASNDDISMLNEMRVLARENTWLNFDEIIRIATMGGAKALGLEEQIGSLTPGKQADIIAIAAPPGLSKENLSEYVVKEAKQVEFAIAAGKPVFKTGGGSD